MNAQAEIERRVVALVNDAYLQGKVEGMSEGWHRMLTLSAVAKSVTKDQFIDMVKAEAEAMRKLINSIK